MNEQQTEVLTQAQAYVSDLFRHRVAPHFVFHHLEHTQQVVGAAQDLASHYQLTDADLFVLQLAAWFHDTGFSTGHAEEHEKESVRLATEFLQAHGVEAALIQRVSSAIQATRMPQSPLSLVEKILCDADLWHLGSPDFRKMNDQLKAEQEAYFQKRFSKKEWRQRNIEFLESHHYFTEYAQIKQEPKKQEWIRQLRKKQPKEVRHTEEMELSPYTFDTDPQQVKEEASARARARRNKDVERGIQTIFRTTSNNHIQLSEIADNKANIMISINSIIISIMFSVLLGRLEYFPHLLAPTLLLALVCTLAIIFAVLATRPSVSTGTFTEEDIRGKRTNLLFFGNFHKMEMEKYHWAMNELLQDREYIYGSMIKDIYSLGVVLARKYRYLRISYTIFMYGIVVAVVAFGLASYFARP